MVSVGQKAPDFLSPAFDGGSGRMLELVAEIEDHRAVVLLFAPGDFVPACTAEWCALRDAGWHTDSDIAVIGITGDSLFSHAAYAERYELPFPIISDFHAGIADQYDLVAAEWEGHRQIPLRATVVIGGDWEIRALETADPLAHASPAPVTRVHPTLVDLGFDIERPTVEYDAFE